MTFLSKGRTREARQKQDDDKDPHGLSLRGLEWETRTFMGFRTYLMLFSSFLLAMCRDYCVTLSRTHSPNRPLFSAHTPAHPPQHHYPSQQICLGSTA